MLCAQFLVQEINGLRVVLAITVRFQFNRCIQVTVIYSIRPTEEEAYRVDERRV